MRHPTLARLHRWLFLPHRFLAVDQRFHDRPFRLLDVGAGNHGATVARHWFPACRYSGIDRDRGYHNDEADLALTEEFFELDLTTLAFGRIPDAAYDVIVMSHVLEHLSNAADVIRGLWPKLRPGGLLCAEFPGPRSLQLPSMRGTLNFHDDPTHVRPYRADEIAVVVASLGGRVLRAGTRRDARGIVLLPYNALRAWREQGFVPGGVLWDLFGFADFLVGERVAP